MRAACNEFRKAKYVREKAGQPGFRWAAPQGPVDCELKNNRESSYPNINTLYYNIFFFNKKARFVNFTEAVLRESAIREEAGANHRQKEKAYSALRRRAEALNTHPLSQTPPITGRRGSAPPTATRRTGCRLRSLPRANCRWRRPRRSSRLLRRIGYSSTASA